MIRINQLSQAIFDQNRQADQLNAVLAQYQLALQSYENSYSERSFNLSQQALYSAYDQVQRSISTLALNLEEEEAAQFDQFISNNDQLSDITDQVIQAVDDENWDLVLELDDQANTLIGQMNQVVDGFQSSRLQQLHDMNEQTDRFNTISTISLLVMLPVLLILAGLVAVVIYQQINRPLFDLTAASQAVLEDQFQPQALTKLTARKDEIGAIARQFVQMAASVKQRSVLLRQEANAIRAKIR
jgi:nitrogen fixation/metabolism regulation signal transduction histidine kinase